MSCVCARVFFARLRFIYIYIYINSDNSPRIYLASVAWRPVSAGRTASASARTAWSEALASCPSLAVCCRRSRRKLGGTHLHCPRRVAPAARTAPAGWPAVIPAAADEDIANRILHARNQGSVWVCRGFAVIVQQRQNKPKMNGI